MQKPFIGQDAVQGLIFQGPKERGLGAVPNVHFLWFSKKMAGETSFSLENAAASSVLTGGLIALGYGLLKLFRRSKCASHTKCCDIDVARGQDTEDPDRLREMIRDAFKDHQEATAKKPGEDPASLV